MTVRDLIASLQFYPSDATVVFEPRELTGIGLPRWLDATAKEEFDCDDRPTGRVLIRLSEMGEC